MDSLAIASPEIFLLTATCLVLVASLFIGPRSQTVYWLSQAALIVTLFFAFGQWSSLGDTVAAAGVEEGIAGSIGVIAFHGAYGIDGLSGALKVWLVGIMIAVLLFSRDYLVGRRIARGEYYVLALFATAGMMIMVSAQHLLTIYLGLELLALSQYAMVALYRNDGRAAEAAMKFFVLGALASGMLLYGMSMIYGATGSLELAAIREVLLDGAERNFGARFGLTFVIVGIAFKLGAVPFHMWIPDVYEGAPTPVAMFVSTAPKIAAFAMLIKILVGALGSLSADWQAMLGILAALSLVVGNLVAIAQTNIKRMLAYSTIGNIGFLLLGMVGVTPQGYAAAMFYAITYAITTLAAFAVLATLSRASEAERAAPIGGRAAAPRGVRVDELPHRSLGAAAVTADVAGPIAGAPLGDADPYAAELSRAAEPHEAFLLSDLAGLARRSKLLAAVMMVSMFSLAGVPPLVGFYAKLAVLSSVVDAGYLWLAILGVVMSVAGAFYYLRVIKLMYFDEPTVTEEIRTAGDVSAGLAVLGIAIVLLGIFPDVIMSGALAAFG